MSDARLSSSFPTHPKTKKLLRRLGPAGPWALVCLFLWARMNRPDGDLSGMTAEDVELACDWSGDEGALVAALLSVGFLDGEEGGYAIHDWAEHQPWSAGAEDRKQSSAWAALCKRYGRAGAAERMPEYAARMRKASDSDAGPMRPACDPHATRTPTACGTDAPLPSPSPSPSPKKELPSSTGEKHAEQPADPLFGTGLALLVRKGVPEKSARSFLGMLRKSCGDDLAAAALLVRAEANDVSDPVAWLTKAAKATKAGPQLSLVPTAPEPRRPSDKPLTL